MTHQSRETVLASWAPSSAYRTERASFRPRVPGEVFTQQGDTEIFATELQAMKWLIRNQHARMFDYRDKA
jgi:hypothetical protein